jgi:hypothetical protein
MRQMGEHFARVASKPTSTLCRVWPPSWFPVKSKFCQLAMAGFAVLVRILLNNRADRRQQNRGGDLDQSVIDAVSVVKYETVLARIGDEVEVVGATPALHLKLTEVVRSPLDGAVWEAFALYFDGDPARPLSQGTYRLAHPAIGEQDLFLSPKSPVQYEISISRRRGV